ncbi:hypothetical protein CPC08DRAFT_619247, partial [Agrocybe pediades]
LDISKTPAPTMPTHNFRMTDWTAFREDLDRRIKNAPPWKTIQDEDEFNRQVELLTSLMQASIESKVPVNKPNPLSKRWWTKELDIMKKE